MLDSLDDGKSVHRPPIKVFQKSIDGLKKIGIQLKYSFAIRLPIKVYICFGARLESNVFSMSCL